MRGRCPYNKPESEHTTCPRVFASSVTVKPYDFLTFRDLTSDPLTLRAVMPHQVNNIGALLIDKSEFIEVMKIVLSDSHTNFSDGLVCVNFDVIDWVFNTCSFRFKEGALKSVREFYLEACQ